LVLHHYGLHGWKVHPSNGRSRVRRRRLCRYRSNGVAVI
jgi:hypothetical protein